MLLSVPEQRRPPLTRRRERYPSVPDLVVSMGVASVVGWELIQAVRLPDGSVEAVYAR